MTTAVEITFSPQAQAILRRVAAWPQNVLVAIAQTIDQQNLLTVSHIQRQYLSFSKAGPTTPEGLRAISTPGMRGTLHATTATITTNGIVSAIGTPIKNKGVSYPRLHEFGGVVHHPARAGSVRLRTNRGGDLLLQPGRRGAMFAAKAHKNARTVQYQGKAYDVTYPARAPIRRGLADRAPEYTAALDATLKKFYGGFS